MKLQTLFMVTHGCTALAAGTLLVVAAQSGTTTHYVGAAVVSLLAVAGISWFASMKITSGLESLESAIADHEDSETLRTGIDELDHCVLEICKIAARWEKVAADNRRQASEFQSMMRLLSRRGAGSDPSSEQVREMLAGLGTTLHTHLSSFERGASEIEGLTRAITEGTDAQGHAVIKTSTYVEQLSGTIDSVSTSAASAAQATERTADSANSALT